MGTFNLVRVACTVSTCCVFSFVLLGGGGCPWNDSSKNADFIGNNGFSMPYVLMVHFFVKEKSCCLISIVCRVDCKTITTLL